MKLPVFLCVLFAAFLQMTAEAVKARDSEPADKLGWHLATKAYTFRTITLYETLDISKALGVTWLELNPTQKLSKENPVNTDQNLSPELRAQLRARFAEAGIRPACFGVVKLTADEAADRRVFEFAKELGVSTLVSEPTADAFDLLDKLTAEYEISVAIHNHPKPSPYADPESVLKAIAGHGRLIGACADVGHWTRSGLDTVECLRKLEGHIISLHFKDVDEKKMDVPWGTGKSNVPGMLQELKRQNFKGIFSMEYESKNGPELIEELKSSIATFDKEAATGKRE